LGIGIIHSSWFQSLIAIAITIIKNSQEYWQER